jgi:hypothetical protein
MHEGCVSAIHIDNASGEIPVVIPASHFACLSGSLNSFTGNSFENTLDIENSRNYKKINGRWSIIVFNNRQADSIGSMPEFNINPINPAQARAGLPCFRTGFAAFEKPQMLSIWRTKYKAGRVEIRARHSPA